MVQIQVEYFILAELLFQAVGQDHFLEFAFVTFFRSEHQALDHLLGDRAAAAAFFAGLEVGQRRPDNGFEVDAGVRIELVVLNGQKRLGHKGGHLIQGNQVTPFAVQFPDQTAVAGQDRGHQRGAIDPRFC